MIDRVVSDIRKIFSLIRRPIKPPCPVGKRDKTKKTGSKSHKRCIDSYTPNMANSFAAEPFMGWPFGLHSNIGFGWPFSGW